MHNRVRMVVASYLTKHMLTHWRVGLDWFADCLTDWDPAANAMGWQWVAGCGPDAAPYFRVFNPAGQAEKFDAGAAYRRRWLAELARKPGPEALAFFAAAPRSWGLDPRRLTPRRWWTWPRAGRVPLRHMGHEMLERTAEVWNHGPQLAGAQMPGVGR